MKYRLGFDIGSTTIKAVLLDENETMLYTTYRRHRSDIRGEIESLFGELARDWGHIEASLCLTGSAGLGVAAALSLPFVQEVVSATTAVERYHPGADVVIELGGEDAKITFLKPVTTQRMNGTCAGGTGAFIDQMAALLQTDASGLNELASRHTALYTIASRCGVFAKSDLQPLLNEGASHENLAASILQAVVNQTIAGLACGQPIQGTVIFLGGPLCYLSELRGAFERTLSGTVETFITPDHADVFVALGAALVSGGEPVSLRTLPQRLQNSGPIDADITRLPKLFETEADRAEFFERHAREKTPRAPLGEAAGPCFLGVDSGSTTIKAALVDGQGRLLYSEYMTNDGSPLLRVIDILKRMYEQMPDTAYIGHAVMTGYGEALLKTALCADGGEIETLCHTRAAQQFAPDVSFILDIGGQDMKSMTIRDGVLDSVLLNEACSSGCGSFIQTFAESLNLPVDEFGRRALDAESPVDLGTRCTVFMNSRVKQAQKEGAGVENISCGLSYSVIRNALFKVIKMKSPASLGDSVVVQGGTFLNDAILRAFEVVAQRKPVRPDIAGLMGAYGAALLASERYTEGQVSALLPYGRLDEALPVDTKQAVCQQCQNRCKLTVNSFTGNRRLISGNRCEKGEGKKGGTDSPANLIYEKYERLFSYRSLPEESAPRGVIGIPRALNMYENYPLWHAFFTKLGFSVVLSRGSDHGVFEEGMGSIPSESVCYPAKLVHGHIEDLINRGVKTIFYPCVTYERLENSQAGNHFNCPIVQSYPEVIDANIDHLHSAGVRLIKPFLSLHHRQRIAATLQRELSGFGVTLPETRKALAAGLAEMDRFKRDMAARGDQVIEQLEKLGKTGVVLAGRPYHCDPEIHHGLPGLLTGLGFAVLTEDAVAHRARVKRPLRVVDQWMYHTRLYDAAEVVAGHPNLELVQLNSFGCGLDAVTSDQVAEIMKAARKIYTLLKIDEVNSLGAARIRMRSLAVALESRKKKARTLKPVRDYSYKIKEFTPEMRRSHTILAPQMSPVHFALIDKVFQAGGYNLVILENTSAADVETGLRFVNNDACYPCVVVVGQLVNAILSGEYDPDNTSIFITQTGGGCRATNYAAMLRRALREAGYEQVPVVGLSAGGIEKHPGIKWTLSMILDAIKSILIGDLLQMVLLRTRPYEAVPGSADELYRHWLRRCGESFAGTGASMSFQRMIDGIVTAFESLPMLDIPRKPRVGIVGEILVKFHPDANNNAVAVIEKEGCEAMVPGLMGFLQYCIHNSSVKQEVYGGFALQAFGMSQAGRFIESFEHTVRRSLRSSSRFHMETPIHDLADKASRVLSIANQCGEGWLLTAEMIDLIEAGAPNIICAQPFACLPNHVTGKGMIRKLRELYPQSNIVPIDYDPGASEVNQLNRIKLMIAGAFKNLKTAPAVVPAEEREPVGV